MKALDVLKCICVAGILFVHAHFLLITQHYRIYAPDSYLANVTREWMIISVFITLLPITAGCVMRAELGKDFNRSNLNTKAYLKKIVATSFLIASVGFLMNAATWGLDYAFSWNMLQMVAVAYLLIALVFITFSYAGIAVLALAAILLADPLTQWAGHYRENYFVAIWLGNASRYIFWPILPWIALPAFGFLFTHCYLQKGHLNKTKIAIFLLGSFFLAVSIYRNELVPILSDRYVWSHLAKQPKLGEIIGSMGLFCITFTICELVARFYSFSRYGIVKSFSKGILWIYAIQMVASYHFAPYIIEWFSMPTHLEMQTLNDFMAYAFLPCVMLFFGWGVGALLIRVFEDMRFRITFRKVG